MAAKRDVSLNIRLLRKEHASWRKAARAAGLTLSDWIRARCNVPTSAPAAAMSKISPS